MTSLWPEVCSRTSDTEFSVGVEYEGEYKDGQPNGLLIYWYENGQKMREGKLKNGSPIGRWKYYDQDGLLDKTIDH